MFGCGAHSLCEVLASRLVDLHDARLARAPRAASIFSDSAGRWVGLEVDGDGLRVGAVPVRGGVGSCDGVVGRGLDEARRFRVEGRLQVAAGKDVVVVHGSCQSCHAIHAAGDAVPMGRPLEPRHLAALKRVRLRLDDREGREGEDGASNS